MKTSKEHLNNALIRQSNMFLLSLSMSALMLQCNTKFTLGSTTLNNSLQRQGAQQYPEVGFHAVSMQMIV